MEIGLLLPHFSDAAEPTTLVSFCEQVEQLGYDSVWVRDNLGYHGDSGPALAGATFVEPFVTLSAIAARTTTLKLGTAVTIPFRHPLVTAQLVGSLNWVSNGRFEFGVGPGRPRLPFELTNIAYEQRIQRARETVEVLRATSTSPAEYSGETAEFSELTLDPAPPSDLFVWYGGGSTASVRRARRYADGLLPGRCPFPRLEWLLDESRATGKELKVGCIPLVFVGSSESEAYEVWRPHADRILSYLSGFWGHEYTEIAQLEGAVMLGTPQTVAEQTADFERVGIDLLILDLRLQMYEYEGLVTELGQRLG